MIHDAGSAPALSTSARGAQRSARGVGVRTWLPRIVQLFAALVMLAGVTGSLLLLRKASALHEEAAAFDSAPGAIEELDWYRGSARIPPLACLTSPADLIEDLERASEDIGSALGLTGVSLELVQEDQGSSLDLTSREGVPSVSEPLGLPLFLGVARLPLRFEADARGHAQVSRLLEGLEAWPARITTLQAELGDSAAVHIRLEIELYVLLPRSA